MLPSNGSTLNLNIERYFLRLVFLKVKVLDYRKNK
jgi:hypothetical protein